MGGNLSRDAQLGKGKPRLEPRICGILGSRGHKDSASTIPEPQSTHHTALQALHPTLTAVGCLNFSYWNSEAQRGTVTFPRSHSHSVVKTGFTPRNYPLLPRGFSTAKAACCRPRSTRMHQAEKPSSAPHQLCDLGLPLSPMTHSTLRRKVWTPGCQQNCWVDESHSRQWPWCTAGT